MLIRGRESKANISRPNRHYKNGYCRCLTRYAAVIGTRGAVPCWAIGDLAPLNSICEKPHLLNQPPFTTAILKEILRLFPVVPSTRAGEPGYSVRDEPGRLYPTDGCLVWSVHHAIHRDPALWPQPYLILPERWLVSSEDLLFPRKGAWRPFEFGSRNCIG